MTVMIDVTNIQTETFENKNLKKRKLVHILSSVLQNSKQLEELKNLMNSCNIKWEDIVRSYIDYNLDLFNHSNEIYDSMAIRFVLYIHNLLKGSWHIGRQKIALSFIKKLKPNNIIDIGFGVPSLYVKYLLENTSTKITLCDVSKSSIQFSKRLIQTWNPSYKHRVNFLQEDLVKTKRIIANYDLYIMQHSLEHVPNPEECLNDYVRLSLSNAKFLVSIPMGPIISEHYISWENEEQVIRWLSSCGLEPIWVRTIGVNPKIDLFAEQLNYNFSDYIAICKKSI